MSAHPIRHLVSAALLFGLLAAGSKYAAIDPQPYEIGGAYTVDPQRDWSGFRTGTDDDHVWTVDGPALEVVYLWAAVEDGEALIHGEDEDDKDVPVYRQGMRAGDVAELVAASASFWDGAPEVSEIRPAEFGSLDGFRFAYSFADPNGLRKRGVGLGAITGDGKLHLVIYQGAAEYYFDAYQRTVEALFESIRTI